MGLACFGSLCLIGRHKGKYVKKLRDERVRIKRLLHIVEEHDRADVVANVPLLLQL